MKIKIALFVALHLIASLVATGTAIASEDVLSEPVKAAIQPSSKVSQGNSALSSLALALSSGKDAMRSFRVQEVRISLRRTGLILPLPGWIAISIVSLLMSRALVRRLTLKKKLWLCSHRSLMNYKPPCHRIDGEECKRSLGPLRSEAIPTTIKDLTPISIAT